MKPLRVFVASSVVIAFVQSPVIAQVVTPSPNLGADVASQVISSSQGGNVLDGAARKVTGLAAGELNQAAKSWLDQYFPYAEFGVGLGSPTKPTFGALVVAPLSNREDVVNTIFNQTSIYHNDGRTTLNLGLGYRRLASEKKILLGVNAFYDQEFPHNHQRSSIGFEARSNVAEVNANRYISMSNWKGVGAGYEERALGGHDIELGLALPYTPWAKIYGRKFQWNAYDGASNIEGSDYTLRAAIPLLPGLVIEAGRRDFVSGKDVEFARITFQITGPDRNRESKPLFTEQAYHLTSMEDRRYEKVRRENLIIKQRRSQFKVSFVGI